MIDHVSVRVRDLPKLAAFYREALAPLGYKVIMEFPGVVGLGSVMPDLWLMQTDKPLNPTHVAISSGARGAIDAFYAAALAAGGTDNGAPGLRADYHPHYYAAFVHDPEGNNIELVCHLPPGAPKGSPSRAKKSPAKKRVATPAKKSSRKSAMTSTTKSATKKGTPPVRKAEPDKAKTKIKPKAKKSPSKRR